MKLFFLLLCFFLPYLLHQLFFQRIVNKLMQSRIQRENYLGVTIPTAGGLILLVYHTVTLFILILIVLMVDGFDQHVRHAVLLGIGSFAVAIWGWLDDCSLEKEVKGFHGHLRTLLSEHRMTSGLLKAWGGGGTALIISMAISKSAWEILIHTGLLALSTNLINLFDLRPTRAIKAFWLILAFALSMGALFTKTEQWVWALPIICSTCLIFSHDAKARLMLGDTGSNFLGFIAGFFLVTLLPLPVKVTLLSCFLLLHFAAEYVSFSRVIQSVSWLERLDQWGRRT